MAMAQQWRIYMGSQPAQSAGSFSNLHWVDSTQCLFESSSGSRSTFLYCADIRISAQRCWTCTDVCIQFGHGSTACVQRNESIDLNSIHVNPARPHEFAAAGDEEWAYVYDARMVRMQRQALQVTPAAAPVAQFCPSHLMSESRRAFAHITACSYSRRGELLLSYSGDGIYLFHPWLKGQSRRSAPCAEEACPVPPP